MAGRCRRGPIRFAPGTGRDRPRRRASSGRAGNPGRRTPYYGSNRRSPEDCHEHGRAARHPDPLPDGGLRRRRQFRARARGDQADCRHAGRRRRARCRPRSTRRCSCASRTWRRSPRRSTQPDQRQFAYEMAVCVCDADGATSPAEREFLGRLAQALGLDAGAAQAFTQQADAVTGAPLEGAALDGAIVAAVPANARRARQDDPQLLDSQRGAGAAAAVAGVDGHHSAADEDGLPGRQGARLRARPRPHQGPARDDGRRPHVAVRRADRPQAARRVARQDRRRARWAAWAARRPAPPSPSPPPTRWATSRSATTPAAARSTRPACSRRSRRCWARRSSCRASTRARSPSRRARST